MTQQEFWQIVQRTHADWMQLENVERGYDFKASSRARDRHLHAKQFYELLYGEKWSENNC